MKLKEYFTNNLTLKILAILGAIFLWTYVINEGYRVDFLDAEVPLEAFNIAEDLALSENLGTVMLKVRVPTGVSASDLLEDTKAFVDLKSLRPGTYEKEIKVSFEDSAITLLELNPEKITLNLEELESIEKEIEVEIKGEVGENYQTQDTVLSLTQAEIKGAGSSLEKVEKLVAPIEVAGEMSEIKKIVELEARDADNNKITEVSIHPKNVEVTVPITTKEEIKTVGIKANLSGDPASGFFVTQTNLNPNTVTIRGESEILSSINVLNSQDINIEGISDNADFPVEIVLPEGIEIVDQQNITITVSLDAQLVSRTIGSKIDFSNIDSDLELNSYDPNDIKVIVEGPAPVINNLTTGGVVTNINLSGKGAGSFNLPIDPSMITLPENVSLKSIESKDLKITLKKK